MCSNKDELKKGGLFLIDLKQEKDKRPNGIKELSTENLNLFAISMCKRMLAIVGPKNLQLWSLPDMEIITIQIMNAQKEGLVTSMKFTSDHLFLKYERWNDKSLKYDKSRGWGVISLKETKLSTTIKGQDLVGLRKHTKKILYTP